MHVIACVCGRSAELLSLGLELSLESKGLIVEPNVEPVHVARHAGLQHIPLHVAVRCYGTHASHATAHTRHSFDTYAWLVLLASQLADDLEEGVGGEGHGFQQPCVHREPVRASVRRLEHHPVRGNVELDHSVLPPPRASPHMLGLGQRKAPKLALCAGGGARTHLPRTRTLWPFRSFVARISSMCLICPNCNGTGRPPSSSILSIFRFFLDFQLFPRNTPIDYFILFCFVFVGALHAAYSSRSLGALGSRSSPYWMALSM